MSYPPKFWLSEHQDDLVWHEPDFKGKVASECPECKAKIAAILDGIDAILALLSEGTCHALDDLYFEQIVEFKDQLKELAEHADCLIIERTTKETIIGLLK